MEEQILLALFIKNINLKNKPTGIDIVANKDVKKNIIFKKVDAIKYLKKKDKYDLILIKQTIIFFQKLKIKFLILLEKAVLDPKCILN